VGTFRLSIRTGNQTQGTIVPETVFAEVSSQPSIETHERFVDIRDVRTPAGVSIPPEPGVIPATPGALNPLMTTDGQGNVTLADGVTAAIDSRAGQQRVDVSVAVPPGVLPADFFAAVDLADPEAGILISAEILSLTARDALNNVSEVPVSFLAIPDPDVTGGVLIEASIRGQAAVDLAGRQLQLRLSAGQSQLVIAGASLNAGLVATPLPVGPAALPALPTPPAANADAAVIGTPAGAGTPVERLASGVSGTVLIDNRLSTAQRLDIEVTNVPVTAFANSTGLLANGVVPQGLDVQVSGLFAEFLDASGNVIGVSPFFAATFQTTSTVTLTVSIRDGGQATLLGRATEVRLVQSNSGSLGVTDLVTASIADGTTVQITPAVPTPVVAGP